MKTISCHEYFLPDFVKAPVLYAAVTLSVEFIFHWQKSFYAKRSVLVLFESMSVCVGKAWQQKPVVIANFACVVRKKSGVLVLGLLSLFLFWGPWSIRRCYLHSGWVFFRHLQLSVNNLTYSEMCFHGDFTLYYSFPYFFEEMFLPEHEVVVFWLVGKPVISSHLLIFDSWRTGL